MHYWVWYINISIWGYFLLCFVEQGRPSSRYIRGTHSSLISYRLLDNSFLSLFLILVTIIHLYKPVPCSRKFVPIQSLLKFLEVPREFDLGLASILYFNKYSLYLRGSCINLIWCVWHLTTSVCIKFDAVAGELLINDNGYYLCEFFEFRICIHIVAY